MSKEREVVLTGKIIEGPDTTMVYINDEKKGEVSIMDVIEATELMVESGSPVLDNLHLIRRMVVGLCMNTVLKEGTNEERED